MTNVIEIGKIVNTRGLKGELKVYPYLDDFSAFDDFEYLLIDSKKFNIRGVKFFKNMVFVTLEGVDTVEKAELLKNKICGIFEEDLPELYDGEYYVKDILGLEVYTDGNEYLGVVSDVLKTGSNDVYEVKREGLKSMYLPAIKDVVKSIDTVNKKITVHIIDGLDEI